MEQKILSDLPWKGCSQNLQSIGTGLMVKNVFGAKIESFSVVNGYYRLLTVTIEY
jgi:hypothetical protein